MITLPRGRTHLTVILAMAVLFVPAAAFGQLNGPNIKGDAGLKSGSQAPSGAYVAVPLWFYSADALKDREGAERLSGSLDSAVFGVALNVVTTKKIFAANYGFLVGLPWANNRLQGGEDFDANPGVGLTDMFIQPLSLGWHGLRADATVGYGIYVPTGRYDDGASNNTGLGMWAQEILVGTTVYMNERRTLHAATMATFDFPFEKKDSETKVGNILNLEGGVGADFLNGGLTTGLAYYGTFKLTDDRFDARLPSLLIRGKNRVWGLGPEVTLAIAARRTVYGFVTVRYQWEVGARTTTEGGAWNILATFPTHQVAMIGAEPRDADGAVRDPYEEERTRLSRELHDDIAQRIALASAGMGMRERARLVHAQLLISSTSGSGTVIEAHVPVRPRFDCPSW